mgnify:CR=1 FL=1
MDWKVDKYGRTTNQLRACAIGNWLKMERTTPYADRLELSSIT